MDRKAVQLDVVLAPDADPLIGERSTLGDDDLRTDKVDACDHLGDGVLNLNAGIHLDKVIVLILVDQKFQRSRIGVANMLGDRDGVSVELFLDLL